MSAILTPETAQKFAAEWLAAWNARDLDRILQHYARDVEFTSPLVSRFLDREQNTVRGIAMLRVYFRRALNAHPELQFVFRRVYCGAQSVVIEYRSVAEQLAAEMMELDEAGLVCRVNVHYTRASSDVASS